MEALNTLGFISATQKVRRHFPIVKRLHLVLISSSTTSASAVPSGVRAPAKESQHFSILHLHRQPTSAARFNFCRRKKPKMAH
ncbi:hypothetical protein BDW66DRAFT_131910 [Aspergillus desertorum]